MQTDHQHSPEDERASREAALDETIEATFPASDPLSTIPNPDDRTALERKHSGPEPEGQEPTDPS
ncbi:MAG TPA: hypothetical protein VFH33_03160 [Candidatus Krumholzibacteria bacterium]|nr:hypothetical protein [Candidatus Krumholzibacteria bacterium]